MLDRMADPEVWERFIEYHTDPTRLSAYTKGEARALRRYADEKRYLEVLERVRRGEGLSLPLRKRISKKDTSKKRTVYTFPPDENIFLKMMTYLLIREYDDIFTDDLYSFRSGTGAQKAIHRLAATKGISSMYGYKVDVSDYFNSADVTLLLPELMRIFADDPELYGFIEMLLTDGRARVGDKVITEPRGIMAGVPTASFLANVYLLALDRHFEGRVYARYSDDIIIFSPTSEAREEAEREIHDTLETLHLRVNPKKEYRIEPHTSWDFLGFSYCDGRIDVCPASVEKLKAKMKRKSSALLRWKRAKGLTNRNAARAFVKIFNRKLYENRVRSELTWARWYFPVINSTDALRQLDSYMQDCIRYIATEKRTKRRFDFRYEDIRALGYRSLVNEYYRMRRDDV